MHELYWNAANYVQISHKRQDLFSSHNHYKSLYIDIWFHQLWQVLEFYDNIFCTLIIFYTIFFITISSDYVDLQLQNNEHYYVRQTNF